MARGVTGALAAALACLTAGCLLPDREHGGTSSVSQRLRPQYPPDAVIMQIVLIERDLNDPLLNDDVWQSTDQLAVSPARRALLEENGLRVGQVVGPTAAGLQRLLTSDRWCKHNQRILPSGHQYVQDLGMVHPHCQYDVHLGKKPIDLQADQARFCFDVTPTHTADGMTKLQFVPKVETNGPALPFQPSPEQSTWIYRAERPSQAYPELAWDVKLQPNEYLIVGAHPARKNTIGHRAFVQEEGPAPVQRLLVIRTMRPGTSEGGAAAVDDLASSYRSPPLALQATTGAIRASRP